MSDDDDVLLLEPEEEPYGKNVTIAKRLKRKSVASEYDHVEQEPARDDEVGEEPARDARDDQVDEEPARDDVNKIPFNLESLISSEEDILGDGDAETGENNIIIPPLIQLENLLVEHKLVYKSSNSVYKKSRGGREEYVPYNIDQVPVRRFQEKMANATDEEEIALLKRIWNHYERCLEDCEKNFTNKTTSDVWPKMFSAVIPLSSFVEVEAMEGDVDDNDEDMGGGNLKAKRPRDSDDECDFIDAQNDAYVEDGFVVADDYVDPPDANEEEASLEKMDVAQIEQKLATIRAKREKEEKILQSRIEKLAKKTKRKNEKLEEEEALFRFLMARKKEAEVEVDKEEPTPVAVDGSSLEIVK